MFDVDRGFSVAFSFIAFEPYSFVAIPLFLLMGFVCFHEGFSGDIYRTTRVWLSRVHGGLAMASVAGCAMFAAVSGSSLATAAAMGRLAVPEMLRYRYDQGLATGVVAASGTLGSLIPPSILMILYGLFTEQSIARLLLAGLVPGILSAAIYMVMIWLRARAHPDLAPKAEAVTWAERFGAIKGTWSIIVLFTLIIGGIYLGVFTPTESAAVGAWLLAFLGRRLTYESSRNAIIDTVKQTAIVFLLVLSAKIFVTFIAFTGISNVITAWATGLDVAPIWILLALSFAYIILGTFMDPLGHHAPDIADRDTGDGGSWL